MKVTQVCKIPYPPLESDISQQFVCLKIWLNSVSGLINDLAIHLIRKTFCTSLTYQSDNDSVKELGKNI